MVRYCADLRDYNPSDTDGSLNILVFGIMGAGKSSWIQTILTMLSTERGNVIQHATTVGGAASHGTTTLRSHELPGLNCTLWDTWGLSDSNYQTCELSAIVQGILPSKWEMSAVFKDHEEPILAGLRTRKFRRAHAVLFFIPFGALSDPEEQASTRNQFHKLVALHLNPIVVLARVDELNPRVREDPFESHLDIQRARKKASDMFGIPLSRVQLAVPYFSETTRVFDLERLAYKVLELSMQAAADFKSLGEAAQEDGEAFDWGVPEKYSCEHIVQGADTDHPPCADACGLDVLQHMFNNTSVAATGAGNDEDGDQGAQEKDCVFAPS